MTTVIGTILGAAVSAILGAATPHLPAVRIPPSRVVVVGDSIAFHVCEALPTAECTTFPGAFIVAQDGTNLTSKFLTEADPQPDDVLVISSVGAWHTPTVGDAEIAARVVAAIDQAEATGAHVVWLIGPEGGFPACGKAPTPAALENFGQDRNTPCATMAVIRETVLSTGVDTLTIDGPYLPDQIHQTPEAVATLAAQILSL